MSRFSAVPPADIDSLRRLADSMQLSLPLNENLDALSQQQVLQGRHLSNICVALPMEGCDASHDGAPGSLTQRRYVRMAEGGAGLLWFEATSVVDQGRANPHGLWIHEGSLGQFSQLVSQTRKAAPHNIVCLLQLTHAGRYSRRGTDAAPLIAEPVPGLDPDARATIVTDDHLRRLQDSFVEAARSAMRAGFDGVDIKACHGYLVSSLLSARTRSGPFGGSFENRTRFLTETVARVRSEVGCMVAVRLNAFDARAGGGGWGDSTDNHLQPDLAEPFLLAQKLREFGVALLSVSAGYPRHAPRFGRPSCTCRSRCNGAKEHPLGDIVRLMNATERIGAAGIPVVYCGLAWFRNLLPHVAAAILIRNPGALIGQGRNSIAYPQWAHDLARHHRFNPTACCITCSGCSELMRSGAPSGCVVRDRDIYGTTTHAARNSTLTPGTFF